LLDLEIALASDQEWIAVADACDERAATRVIEGYDAEQIGPTAIDSVRASRICSGTRHGTRGGECNAVAGLDVDATIEPMLVARHLELECKLARSGGFLYPELCRANGRQDYGDENCE
jgi:hypothetical protein